MLTGESVYSGDHYLLSLTINVEASSTYHFCFNPVYFVHRAVDEQRWKRHIKTAVFNFTLQIINIDRRVSVCVCILVPKQQRASALQQSKRRQTRTGHLNST